MRVPVLDAAGHALIKDGKTAIEGWAAQNLGRHFVNIGTFAAFAVSMLAGSSLKPKPKHYWKYYSHEHTGHADQSSVLGAADSGGACVVFDRNCVRGHSTSKTS